MRQLLGLCFSLISLCLSAQSEFMTIGNDLMAYRSINKSVYNYGQTNVRILGPEYKSIELDLNELLEMDHMDIVEDLNANENIIHLKLDFESLFSSRNKDTISIFPFDSLKHIEYLTLKSVSPKRFRTQNWGRIDQMSSLKYMSIFGFQTVEIDSEDIKSIISKLEGFGCWNCNLKIGEVDHRLKELYLKGSEEEISGFLANLNQKSTLQRLRLSETKVTPNLLKEIQKYTSISWFDIKKCKYQDSLKVLPIDLPNLEYYKCNGWTLSFINKGTSGTKELDINVSSFSRNQLFENLSKYSSVENLNIYFTNADSIIIGPIPKLIHLETLKVGGQYRNIFPNIGELLELKELDLKYSNLEYLPPSINQLKNLRKLDLSRTPIVSLPEISKLKKLEELIIGGTKIESLPDNICKLKKLKTIKLLGSSINSLPNSIKKLQALKELDLRNTCLTELPREIGKLKHLESFSYSPIKTCDSTLKIPATLAKCKSLKSVFIDNAEVSNELASGLINLDLESMIIRNCGLRKLPTNGWEISRLENLDLSENKLTEIPKGLLLSSINKINLRKNGLGIYNQILENETQRKLAAYHLGYISKDDMLNAPYIVNAISEIASRFYFASEENPIQVYLPLALEIEGEGIYDKIDPEKLANSFYQAKKYKEAIQYYNISIDRDTLSRVQFSNAIASNIQDRSKSYLAIGDTTNAIKDLELIQSKFGFDMSNHLFELYLAKDRRSDIKGTAKKMIAIYEKAEMKDSTSYIPGIQLSIMEIYLTSGLKHDFRTSSIFSGSIKMDPLYRSIFEYLNLLNDLEKSDNKVEVAENWISEKDWTTYENISWNCDVIDTWVRFKDKDFQDAVRLLHMKICPN